MHLASGAEAAAAIIFHNCKSLTFIDLSDNALGPGGAELLRRCISGGSEALAVKTLRLKHCKLGDAGCASLLSLLEEWCPYLRRRRLATAVSLSM